MSDSDAAGFFDTADAIPGVERDNQGRPLIRQPDGTRRAYTRASSLGDYLAETEFLRRWEKRYLARQMGKNEDLAALAALESYSTGFDEDAVTKSQSGKRLDAIIDRALDRGRIDERADYGTVIHALTEPGTEGYVPIRAALDVAAFWELVAVNDIRIVGTELFIVNDRWKVAGTFDHLVEFDGKFYIADKKNGRNIKGLGFSVQFVSYADGMLYDPQTEARTPLTSLTDGEPIQKDIALLFEVKDGKAVVRDVDIKRGRQAAQVAAQVRDMRAWSSLANISKRFEKVGYGKTAPEFRQRAIITRIQQARVVEELKACWTYYGPNGTGDWPNEPDHPISQAYIAKKSQEGWQ